MSILYSQSFKQFAAAPNSDVNFLPDVGLWSTFNNDGVATGRRASTNAFQNGNTTGSFNNHLVWWVDPVLQYAGSGLSSTIRVGFAVNITHNYNYGTICNLYSGSTNIFGTGNGDPGTAWGPIVGYDGAGNFYTGNGTAIKTTPTTGSAWYYVEIENQTGSPGVTIKIDGVQVYQSTSWNVANVKAIHWFSPPNGGGVGAVIQDIVVSDSSGSVNNTFLGDCRVEGIVYSSAGTLQEQTSGAIANVSSPNGDTSFVTLGAVGQRISANMTAPANTSGTIAAVVVKGSAKKLTGTARTVKGIVRISSTVYESSAAKDPQTQADYNEVDLVFDTNPNTGAAWTTAAASALEAGVKLAS